MVSIRLSPFPLLLGTLSLCWALSCPVSVLADEPSQSQPTAKPAQAPPNEHPKYTPEQQQKLDRANELITQVSKLYAQGKYRDAIPMATEALKLREVVLGPVDDHLIANACCWLGVLHQYAGNYSEALPLLQRALKIDEQVYGPDHPDVATDLNDLAGLYQDQGNYAEALPLYQRALIIREKAFGPDHPDITTELSNLAELYSVQGNYAEALPLYQRALKIDEKAHGPDHLDVASDLNNLALLYQAQESYAKALPMFQRALMIQEKTLGPDHPDVATELNNLADLHRLQGNYAEALPLYQRAVKIHEKALGPDHLNVATDLNNLVLLYEDQGKYAQALPLAHRVLTILRQQLERTAVVQSERQQLLMADMVRFYLNNYLTVAHEAGAAEQAYAEVLAWKGSVSARQQAMRQFRNNQQDPKVAALYGQLADTARQLDSLSRATPKPEQAEQYRQQLAELNDSLESLQQQLAAASVDYRRELDQQKLTPADLQHVLPPDTVLVDLLEYNHYQPPKVKGQAAVWEPRLAAFVIRPQQPIQWIELGPSQPIADLVDRWRQRYSATDGAELRRLVWQPLEDKISGTATVLISPDGALDRFPLAALPGKKADTYLIEDVAIATIPIPRLLPQLLAEAAPSGPAANHSLLTVGEVDFNAGLVTKTSTDQLALRAPQNRDGGGWRFLSLDGTRAEIVAINDSFEQRFPDGQHQSLRKAQATKQAVCNAMPHFGYLHLATHGFFAPPELKSALAGSGTNGAKRSISIPDARSALLDVAGYHPDLLVGLALAGANQQAEPGQDDGILTALAVEELDLSHVQLATLSACETGLGQTAGGEGVLGLQRAFQLAGARSTVATLWKIPDKPSQLLMTDFYENLWNQDKHISKLEALRQAQLKMLREGAQRGLELPDDTSARERRLSPFYWAAFELSGDWR